MKRPLIVLDLDNTLIFSSEVIYGRVPNGEIVFEDMITYERPHLQSFLDWLFSRFQVAVWTAGTLEYAVKIVAHFVLPENRPGRKIQFLFHRTDVEAANNMYGGLKDLRYINDIYPNRFGKIILVDDHFEAKMTNGDKCLQVPGFGGNYQTSNMMVNDKELLNIINDLNFIY